MVQGAPDYSSVIRTIKDALCVPQTLIQNPSYEQGMAGWAWLGGSEDILIETTDGWESNKCLRFPANMYIRVFQLLSIPIDVSWLTSLEFYLKSASLNVDLLQVSYVHTDLTTTTDVFQVSSGAFERKQCTLTAGKKIQALRLEHLLTYPECKVDNWLTVV